MNAPKITDFDDLPMPQINRFIATNGVNVSVINGCEQDIFQLLVILPGGKCDSTNPRHAMAAASMLNKGSIAHNAEEIAAKFDHLGVSFSAGSYDRHSVVSLTGLNRTAESAMSILKEILAEPTFPSDRLSILKRQLTDMISQNEAKTDFLASRKFTELLYGQRHPLSRFTRKNPIATLSRADLVDFHRMHMKSTNANIILAGNITDKTIDHALAIFDESWPHSAAAFSQPRIVKANPHPDKSLFAIHRENAVQSSIVTGSIFKNTSDEEFTKLKLLTHLLGGYFGSRLMQIIREQKGYTYGISAVTQEKEGIRNMIIRTDCNIKYTDKVIAAIGDEIRSLIEETIEEDELKLVKSSILSSYASSIDNAFNIANLEASRILKHRPFDSFERDIHTIRATTTSDLHALAEQHLQGDVFYTVVATDCASSDLPV
ncbi:MAG: M16 family metallopeptidase [Muribaculaceae bacterium]